MNTYYSRLKVGVVRLSEESMIEVVEIAFALQCEFVKGIKDVKSEDGLRALDGRRKPSLAEELRTLVEGLL